MEDIKYIVLFYFILFLCVFSWEDGKWKEENFFYLVEKKIWNDRKYNLYTFTFMLLLYKQKIYFSKRKKKKDQFLG